MTKRLSRRMSLEQRQKISIANTGKKKSEETKQRISEAMKAYWSTIPFEAKDKEEESEVQA